MKARLLSAAATVLMLLVVLAALPLVLPRLFGCQIYQVLTSSMEPALPVGSVIYVLPCQPDRLQPGDIVTFTLSGATDLVETHRVVANDPQAQQLTTKGDANSTQDIDPVAYGRVVGRVALCIPGLGALAQAVHTPGGIAVCIGLFALAFILWTLADKSKRRSVSK